MVTIIGTGGHAQDIRSWFPNQSAELVNSFEPIFGAYIGINDGSFRRKLDAHEARFDGVLVGPNSTVGPGVTLGRHTHINANCFVTRAALGDYCTVGPGVTICGDVTIGDDVTIGAGATISNFVTIAAGSYIGAGAVVTPHTDITSGVWVGVPARKLYAPTPRLTLR